MYRWARSQNKLILVAGHTHRPVWSSLTHLDQLEFDLAIEMDKPMTPVVEARIAELEAEIEARRAKSKPCGDEAFRHSPVYFNTGCCRFSDGDITGIEVEMGDLRLIKWSGRPSQRRTVLESGKIADLFQMLA